MINNELLRSLDDYFDCCIREDLGPGDYSSEACIPSVARGRSELLAKESGIVAGLALADYLLKKFDPDAQLRYFKSDGERVEEGDILFEAEGRIRALLSSERLILNFIQRLSGIATRTSQYVAKASKYGVRVADTRKTTPGMRLLEKAAVRAGGGMNHRMGLYDLIMIKDNHADFAGGIARAVDASMRFLDEEGLKLKIEVETRNLEEVREALKSGWVDIIMLDNFEPGLIRQAVDIIDGRTEIEASGNITYENLEDYASTGIDYLSTGALTHSVRSLDMSLRAVFDSP